MNHVLRYGTTVFWLLLLVMLNLAIKPTTAQINPGRDPELPGTYVCTGLSPEGKPYAGTVVIVAHSHGRFEVRWTFPDPNGGDDAEIGGIGIIVDGKFSVSYFAGYPAIAVYSIEKADPLTLKGQWAIPPADGMYPETLTKLPPGHPRPAPVAPKKKAKPEGTTQA